MVNIMYSFSRSKLIKTIKTNNIVSTLFRHYGFPHIIRHMKIQRIWSFTNITSLYP